MITSRMKLPHFSSLIWFKIMLFQYRYNAILKFLSKSFSTFLAELLDKASHKEDISIHSIWLFRRFTPYLPNHKYYKNLK